MGCLDGMFEFNAIVFMIAIYILFCQIYALLSIYILTYVEVLLYSA
jgi:hypothetical protein